MCVCVCDHSLRFFPQDTDPMAQYRYQQIHRDKDLMARYRFLLNRAMIHQGPQKLKAPREVVVGYARRMQEHVYENTSERPWKQYMKRFYALSRGKKIK